MLATLRVWHERNLSVAEPEYKRALELNSNYAEARAFYSHYLNIMGRPREAMAQIDSATELDPFNTIVQTFRIVDLMWVRRYDDSIALARQLLRTEPSNLVALPTLSQACLLAGRPVEEVFAPERAYLKVMYGGSDLEAALDQGYAQGGYKEAMRRAADILAARSRTTLVLATDVAWLYLEAGERSKSLDWLEKGVDANDPNILYVGWPPNDRLRAEPRFKALLRRVGLPVQ
jgi:tetratricopeptide (TPR) repeat protein